MLVVMNMSVQMSLQLSAYNFWSVYAEMELLYHRVILCLIFLGTGSVLLKADEQ